jgi:hypothetical protein
VQFPNQPITSARQEVLFPSSYPLLENEEQEEPPEAAEALEYFHNNGTGD